MTSICDLLVQDTPSHFSTLLDTEMQNLSRMERKEYNKATVTQNMKQLCFLIY